MARRNSGRDLTIEEFDEWVAAGKKVDAVVAAADEEGGPRLSLVPVPATNTAAEPPDTFDPDIPAVPFDPEPSRRVRGWNAPCQRRFIEALAETGSVHLAAKAAGLSARGAYALRLRSGPFAAAWDNAQQLAVGRLSALAFDRAIHGRVDQVYRDGALIAEKRVPSDRLLMWLLARLDPKRFAAPWELRADGVADPQGDAQRAFPSLVAALTDTPHEREHS